MKETKITFYCHLVNRGIKKIEEVPKEYQAAISAICNLPPSVQNR